MQNLTTAQILLPLLRSPCRLNDAQKKKPNDHWLGNEKTQTANHLYEYVVKLFLDVVFLFSSHPPLCILLSHNDRLHVLDHDIIYLPWVYCGGVRMFLLAGSQEQLTCTGKASVNSRLKHWMKLMNSTLANLEMRSYNMN